MKPVNSVKISVWKIEPFIVSMIILHTYTVVFIGVTINGWKKLDILKGLLVMIIYHFETDSTSHTITSGGCASFFWNPIIGRNGCQECIHNHKIEYVKKEVHCSLTATRDDINLYWFDEQWVSEHIYKTRFVSDEASL